MVAKMITKLKASSGLSIGDLAISILSPAIIFKPQINIKNRVIYTIKVSLLNEKNSVVRGRKKIGTNKAVNTGTNLAILFIIDVKLVVGFMNQV